MSPDEETPIRDENGNLTRKLTLDDILNDTYDAVDYWTNRAKRLERTTEKALEEGKLHTAYALYRDIQLELFENEYDERKFIKYELKKKLIIDNITKKILSNNKEKEEKIIERLYKIAEEANRKFDEIRFLKTTDIILTIQPKHIKTYELLIDNALIESTTLPEIIDSYFEKIFEQNIQEEKHLETAFYFYQTTKNKEKEEKVKEELIRRFPNNKPNNFILGKVTHYSRITEQALSFLKQAVKESDNDQVHLFLGKTYINIGKVDEAINHLMKAREIKETYIGNFALAYVLELRNRPEEAIELLKISDRMCPSQPNNKSNIIKSTYSNKEENKDEILKLILDILNNPRTKKTLAGKSYYDLYTMTKNVNNLNKQLIDIAYILTPSDYDIAVGHAQSLLTRTESEKAKASIEITNILKDFPDGYRNNLLLGLEQVNKGNNIKAIEYFFSGINDFNKKKNATKMKGIPQIHKLIQENFARIGNVEKIINETREYLQNNQIENSMGDFFVTILDYASKEDESNQTAKEVINMFKQNPKFLEALEKGTQLQSFGTQSKNNVNTVNTSALSHNIYVIKTQNEHETTEEALNRIRYEFTTTTFVEESLKQVGIKPKTSKVLDAFVNNNKPYLFIKRINQPTLQEITLTEKEKNKEIEYAIETLANIHTATKQNILQDEKGIYMSLKTEQGEQKIYLPINNKINELVARTFTGKKGDTQPRLGFTNSTQKLIDKYQQLLQGQQQSLNNLFFIHDDSFVTNILKGGHVIDFEKAKLGNPLRDIYTFIDNPIFTDVNTEGIIHNYINKLSKNFNNAQIINIATQGKEERLFNLFRQLGSSIQQGKEELAQFYTNKLIEQAPPVIKDSFVKCIKESPHEYIKKVL